jgi:hypothetical protein
VLIVLLHWSRISTVTIQSAQTGVLLHFECCNIMDLRRIYDPRHCNIMDLCRIYDPRHCNIMDFGCIYDPVGTLWIFVVYTMGHIFNEIHNVTIRPQGHIQSIRRLRNRPRPDVSEYRDKTLRTTKDFSNSKILVFVPARTVGAVRAGVALLPSVYKAFSMLSADATTDDLAGASWPATPT